MSKLGLPDIKRTVSGPNSDPVSTNYIAEIAKGLRELKIAYKVMSRHPDVLNEFVNAVRSGTGIPPTEETAGQKPNVLTWASR